MNEPDSLTPQEVADLLRITKNTVYELVKRGELPAVKVGKKLRFDRVQISAWLAGANQGRTHTSSSNQASPLTGTYVSLPQEPLPPRPRDEGHFVLSGQDMILDLLARHVETVFPGTSILRSYQGSYNGLMALYQGTVNAATSHLWDAASNTYNLPFLPHILPGMALRVITLVYRTAGFYVAKGNPKGIRGWEDLGRNDLVFCNREKGSGTRVLLDSRLRILGSNPGDMSGYDSICSNHLAVAAQVAKGRADFGLGNEKAAWQVQGVDFIPLCTERYDLVLRWQDLDHPVVQALTKALSSAEYREDVDMLGGYDTKDMGVYWDI